MDTKIHDGPIIASTAFSYKGYRHRFCLPQRACHDGVVQHRDVIQLFEK